MNRLLAAAVDVQTLCDERGWAFCFIGGLVVQRWGEPRLTRDVDLTVLTGFGDEPRFIDALLERFEGRVEGAGAFALRSRVVLARAPNGVPLDIALGAMPFEERAVHRASHYRFAEGVSLRTCSAEDLIVFKAFAGRARDWADIDGILARQGKVLDRELIMVELEPLLILKDAIEDLRRLQTAMEESDG